LTQAYKNLIPDMISVSFPAVTTLRSSLSTHVLFFAYNFFLISCSVNTSQEITFRITLVFHTYFQISSTTSKLSCVARMTTVQPPFSLTILPFDKVTLAFM
jgi:hypothetical protein